MQRSCLGWLDLVDDEIPDFPRYAGRAAFGLHGEVEVNLVSRVGKDEDWPQLLAQAERVYPRLVASEDEVLREAETRILAIYKRRFEDIQEDAAKVLIKGLTLQNWNYFDDGAIELWYEGNAESNYQDVAISLDPDMRVSEVWFDG